MYGAFNDYLDIDTWHTGHSYDLERFNHALARVINEPGFNPDQMGEHFRSYKNVDRDGGAFDIAVDERVKAGWAVREYMDANGGA